MKRSYTQEQIAKCRQEYAKGKTLTQISLEQDIPRTTIGNWLKRYNGLPIYPPGYPYRSHAIYRQDEHLKKLEDICSILRQVECTVDSPLKVKLYEMEKLAALYPVRTLCAALCVDRGTFYNHLKRNKKENSSYIVRRKEFSYKIKTIYDESNGILGAQKIHHILKQHGDVISLKMVKELMHQMGLKSIRSITAKERLKEKRKKFKKENLLKNVFTASAPNTIWVSDITQYCFLNYRVFICVIVDLYSRKVLAYKVSKKQTTRLVSSTFQTAYANRLPQKIIFHSDRGCQYTSASFREKLQLAQATQSFSRPGTPGDNSVMESFFATLKKEELYRMNYRSLKDFETSLEKYILFYNEQRPHEALKYKTPHETELNYWLSNPGS